VSSLSLSKLLEERGELQKDLIAFSNAFDCIRKRIEESLNSPRTHPPLYKWSGSRAVVGSLEMSIQIIRQNIEEYGEAINHVRSGAVDNSDEDVPHLGVIEGGDHEL